MVIVDIYAHKLAETSSTTQLSEVCNEPRRVAREANDAAVHIHYICMRAIDLRSCCQANVYQIVEPAGGLLIDGERGTHLQRLT